MPIQRTRLLVFAMASATLASCFSGAISPASAQVAYVQPGPFELFVSPYDESNGTSPSFEISPDSYGRAPGVRIVERCQYPDGWNATDFSRDVNGTPAGLDHTCPLTGGRRVKARYEAAFGN